MIIFLNIYIGILKKKISLGSFWKPVTYPTAIIFKSICDF